MPKPKVNESRKDFMIRCIPIVIKEGKNIKLNSSYLKNKSAYILSGNFFKQPHEIVFRSFASLLKKIGGKYYASRGKSINQILSQIDSKKFKKVTLSGCIIEKINNSVFIYKENLGKK